MLRSGHATPIYNQGYHKMPRRWAKLGLALLASSLLASTSTGCTGQLLDSFRLAQQQETFGSTSTQDVNTRLDMLWVVDNSGSMGSSQERLRRGFVSFAQKYMKPTWDIHVAVITTDTYLANPAWHDFLNSYVVSPGTTFRSSYIRGITASGIPGRTTPFVNPTGLPAIFVTDPSNSNYGKLVSGLKVNQEKPNYDSNWAKLLPGNHDGPQVVLCEEKNPDYISPSGLTQCYIRDDQTSYSGPDHCINPGSGETSESQCINTYMNNTVRSGRAIISTLPPAGTPGDQAWTDGLVQDLLTNLSVGIMGQGYEKGLSSVLQLLSDNEAPGSPTAFFRSDSLRVIALVGDEDDQSTVTPTNTSGYMPDDDYGGSCTKNIDGVNFTIPMCPIASKLIPISTIKNKIDTFFRQLDGSGSSGDPNYLVVSIVASTAATVQTIRAQTGATETDRADRFIALGNMVGNGSMVLDINSPDYSPILDSLGQVIVQKKAVFTLQRAPTSTEDMIVWVQHQDGSRTTVSNSLYSISGNILTINDPNFVLSLASTDQIVINYQPRTQI